MNAGPAETFEQDLPRGAVTIALKRDARAELDASCQCGGRRTVERHSVDFARLGCQEIRDAPLSQDVVAERNAIIPEIPQAFAGDQFIYRLRGPIVDVERGYARCVDDVGLDVARLERTPRGLGAPAP